MKPAVLQRQAALVAAALLAGLGVVVLHRADEPSSAAPQPAPTAEVRWQNAVVGVFGPGRYGETTACGVELTDRTMGIAHPVLPCGVDLVVSFRGRELRAEVVDQGPAESDRQFDLTKALADALGVEGTPTIRWRFAG